MIPEMDQPFEPISATEGVAGVDISGFSQDADSVGMEEFSYLKSSQSQEYAVDDIQQQQHQSQIIPNEDEGCYNNNEDHIHTTTTTALEDHMMAQTSNAGQLFSHTSHWEANLQLEELFAHQANQEVDLGDQVNENFSSPIVMPPSNPLYPQTTADVTNIFQLSTCAPPNPSSLLPNSASLSFTNLVEDHHLPLLHLSQLRPHPPFIGDLFQPPSFAGSSMVPACGSVFGNYIGGDDAEGCGAGMFIGDKARPFENTVFEFGRDIDSGINPKRARKGSKTFTTERDRRSQLKERYGDLRQLIPSPTKNDRASVVGDAIQYIEELKGTVNELKFLIDKKRRERERTKRQKIDDEAMDNGASGDGESSITKLPMGGNSDNQSPYSGTALRSSWLQRKSKATEIDVRIVDDEVTIKIIQRKKINCLLHVSRVLDELQLDLQHIAGGHIGEHYSFLFNTKIYEGSSVYASAIASRLMEVVDGQYAATPSCSGY